MTHRTVEIAWLPQSGPQWHTFTAARLDAGRLWSWLVERHADAREQGGIWPSRDDLRTAMKRRFPNLHSQSVQMTIDDFCEAIRPYPNESRLLSLLFRTKLVRFPLG
jgi:hypothetical protein